MGDMFNPSLIWELTKRDYRERYAGSALGVAWALIWPLVPIFIYTMIFGKFMGARLPGNSGVYSYSIYVSAGLIPWNAFANSLSRSTSVFIDNKHIISRVPTSLPGLVIFVHLSETITFLITMSFFFAFLVFTDYRFTHHIFLVPYLFYLQQLLTTGIGIMMATLTVFVRDTKEIINIALQLWFWFTPLVYVPEILPSTLKKLMLVNPTYVITDGYHKIFVFHEYPNFTHLAILSTAGHIGLLVAYAMFRKLEKDVRDFV